MTPATPQQLMALMERRHSCRVYDAARPVEREKIERLLEAARLAPSAVNRQPWQFAVLQGDSLGIATAAYAREWAAAVPAFIVAIGNHAEAWCRKADGKDHTDVDLAIAVEHICLMAAALGLGSCWICNFNPAALSAALGLGEGQEPIAMVAVGYPASGTIPAKTRKPLDEITTWLD